MSVQAGVLWEILVPSAQFFCESKTVLKNKVYLKKKFLGPPKNQRKRIWENLFLGGRKEVRGKKATQVILIKQPELKKHWLNRATVAISIPSLAEFLQHECFHIVIIIILMQFWVLIFLSHQLTFNINLYFRRKIFGYSISFPKHHSKSKKILENTRKKFHLRL